ncbi:MAG: hypothetical protein CW716_00025 [Candidatus Bathyarchaeum sp.]|nr:MAG: hypothetical protein CW716_00025 [Candidatus Bathyarchaeum sp.]
MKLDARAVVGLGLVVVGLLIAIHHFLICGRLFDIDDILHHEFFWAIFFTAGLTLLLVSVFDRK